MEKLKLFPSRGPEPGLFSQLIHDEQKGFSDLLQSAEPNTPPRWLVLPLDLAILFCLAAGNIRRNENYPAPGLLYQSWGSAKNPLDSGSNRILQEWLCPWNPGSRQCPQTWRCWAPQTCSIGSFLGGKGANPLDWVG